MECPVCDKDIIFRDEKYLRCSCGQWLVASKDDEANALYGDWTDEELGELEVGLEFYCDKDLSFFKGRRIFTVWHLGMKPDDIVMETSLKKLIGVLR